MNIYWQVIGSTLFISLLSLLGIITLYFKAKQLDRFLYFVIAFAAGSLLGDAFLHLIPESYEALQSEAVFSYILVGFMLFFLIEKGLHWHHYHHTGKCHDHVAGELNLLGDAVHNLLDGLVIAASFQVSLAVGLASTVAVALHEIPQEIGDFGILLYSGFSRTKALFYNFLSALFAIFGAVLGLVFLKEESVLTFLPIIAGGFIYIAASDLVPELHKEKNINKSFLSLVFFLLGILVMYSLKFLNLE
ncbi:hypothetical protein A2313_04625 [Candidatus Roizmanbacteria bacterium RIFOXYB2_FULL_41_10]|uniref:ZIP family metal transporter n=1 Tax=Candidatus Roizmanbacteria bacterium RIFOXYA1_FULL_41_12 TaxID=1802082 RepID=A0A1F7KEK0_9BACT|nr:MAG: hypothetical protein A2209_01885 [Candidatus Roizmanbacteria bacterium RIFOXYA1_FULL_41_12]OGK67721.1 MAG: hypothetical protein A2377_01475 [Candidatus Roizmanbacteria bacterium RIFOXYB1_FULL_41_27]OGK70692.1 MAG: hypothetical protein A2403_01195 [Candidatus Roizmanbacteria bacterium RIFOXYC1_FULL_41_16]OGK71609.1 MAG: hypothetical protein A2313_04625 [Candidatus Roizmanbacteria bacterium RIFOXYB2_FULL_41_10]OGK74765.1 MAG: hypothetical protein A2575_04075 [Candidatus Roizmanbacteria ba